MKRLSATDHDVVIRLVEKYSLEAVLDAARQVPARRRKVGRPALVRDNLVGVYVYVEHWKKKVRSGGSRYGILGACIKLKDILDRYTVNCRTTPGRLRTMY